MTTRTRLVRLEQRATELDLRRRAAELAAELRQPVDQVLTELREISTWIAQDHVVHPLPVLPDGRVDIEPSLRRIAVAFDLDEEEYVAACRHLVEGSGVDEL